LYKQSYDLPAFRKIRKVAYAAGWTEGSPDAVWLLSTDRNRSGNITGQSRSNVRCGAFTHYPGSSQPDHEIQKQDQDSWSIQRLVRAMDEI